MKVGDLANLARALVPGGAREGALSAALGDFTGVRDVFLVSSGRAAMTLILEALGAAHEGDEVLVPGYTCYSVAASAIRAGLKVRPLDVSPEDLDYARLTEADGRNAVAVVSANLYGAPNDLPRLEGYAREQGIALVDDAAQALGATVSGRAVGTFGDVGIFSFDKGKNITTIQGGVIVCSDAALAEKLATVVDRLPEPGARSVARDFGSVLAYAAFLRPSLYWIPNSLLTLGETPFEVDYPTTRYPRQLESLASGQLKRLHRLSESRRAVAAALRARLEDVQGVVLPGSSAGEGVALRFALLLPDRRVRDETRDLLVEAGIGATASYPKPLIDVPEVQPHLAPGVEDTPGARDIANRVLTLPTHSFVGDREMDRIEDCIRTSLGGYRGVVTG